MPYQKSLDRNQMMFYSLDSMVSPDSFARIIDTFRSEYINLVFSRIKEKLDGLCINGQRYEVYKDGSCVKTNSDTLEDAREFAQDVVDILRAQKIDRRIKDFRVSAYCGEEYLGKYEFPGWFFEEAENTNN